MDMQFTINDNGFRRRLEQTKVLFPNRIKDAVRRGTILMWQQTKDNAPTSFGDLKKSITAEISGLSGTVQPTVNYAEYVHEGTRPHWIAAREALPGGSLFNWARRKGISPWAVRIGIARHGTKARPWMSETFEKNNEKVTEIFEQAIDGSIKDLAK